MRLGGIETVPGFGPKERYPRNSFRTAFSSPVTPVMRGEWPHDQGATVLDPFLGTPGPPGSAALCHAKFCRGGPEHQRQRTVCIASMASNEIPNPQIRYPWWGMHPPSHPHHHITGSHLQVCTLMDIVVSLVSLYH